MTAEIFTDRFHWCALAAGFLAASEGWLHDSERVKQLAYQWYEEGAFRDRLTVQQNQPTVTPPFMGIDHCMLNHEQGSLNHEKESEN